MFLKKMSCSLWWFRWSADAPLLYFLLEQSGEPTIIVFSMTWRQLDSPKLARNRVLRSEPCLFDIIAVAASLVAIGTLRPPGLQY